MKGILLKIRHFEEKLSKSFEKITLLFLSIPVLFNG